MKTKSKEQKNTLRALGRRRLLDRDSDEFLCVMHNLLLVALNYLMYYLLLLTIFNFMELIPLMFLN
jgi:hypothetical protein